MKTVKWISFISTIFVFILSAFLLNRLSNENHCNEHPSISQLNVFIKGRILEIPNCDWYENISQPLNMNSDVKAVITLTQKLPKTKTPFILTIDMDKKQNFRSILNYFWVGQEILYKHIELGIWLKQKSFNYYSGKNESRLINRSLNILSMKVLEGVYPLYNWASKSNLQIEHLSKVLMTHQESCSHYLWDLENLESCKQKVISIKSLSKAPIEILLSNSLFSYYKKLDLKTKVKFSRNLKLVRQKTNFSNLDIIINNKITYNQLVDQYVDLTTKLIKFLLPDKLVNNDILAEILNKQLIFGVTDYLLVTKNMSEHNLKRKTKSFHNLLEVDENGDILSLYGNETPVNMDNLKFSTIIVEGDKFDLQNKIYQNAQFVYLINTKIDRQELLWLGVAGYLLKHKNVSFAKIHVPSIKLRTVSKIILERIKNLGPIMGWTSVKWSEQKASFLPQARIDGVLAYR